MLAKRLNTLPPIVAGDGSELREILHPDRDGLPIGYSLAHALVKPGCATVRHRLAASEVYHIMTGRGIMHVEGDTEHVRAGDSIYIAPGAVQWIENTGNEDLAFLCIVDPPWRSEDEECVE